MQPKKLENTIQPYAWGSRTALADLLGRPSPSAEPQAELWMGAHPKAPSRVDGKPLTELIADHPEEILGAGLAELPYLFKVLAVDAPLSIQAHPDPEQAREGFAREDAASVPRDAPQRNYRDANAKPELIYALTPFTLMRGFRSPAEIRDLAERLGLVDVLNNELQALDDGLRAFFDAWMALPAERLDAALDALDGEDLAAEWIRRLADAYPGDRGILAPLVLHVWTMKPGEVVFTGPGVLHAYLDGLGIELMANSDNVLRGGLTVKHVDVEELRRTLVFEPSPPENVPPEDDGKARHFRAAGLVLSAVEVSAGAVFQGAEERGAEILLGVEGDVVVEAGGGTVDCRRGEAVFLPAAARRYEVRGAGRLFRAAAENLS